MTREDVLCALEGRGLPRTFVHIDDQDVLLIPNPRVERTNEEDVSVPSPPDNLLFLIHESRHQRLYRVFMNIALIRMINLAEHPGSPLR